jgi:PTS system mannose-specific IIA component
VCHGRLAEAMIDAAQRISGVEDALVPVSNAECNRGQIEQRIADAVGNGPSMVFTDMASGSCLTSALSLARRQAEVRVVTGVNLAMLIEFLFHRDLPLDEIAAKVRTTGQNAIQAP